MYVWCEWYEKNVLRDSRVKTGTSVRANIQVRIQINLSLSHYRKYRNAE